MVAVQPYSSQACPVGAWDVGFRRLRPSPRRSRAPAGRWHAALEDRVALAAGGFGVYDDLEAQAVVVQASHQVIVIGVGGDDGDLDVVVSAGTARRHLREENRLVCRSRSACELSGPLIRGRTARAADGPLATTSGTAQSQ